MKTSDNKSQKQRSTKIPTHPPPKTHFHARPVAVTAPPDLGPVVADGVGENLAGVVEGALGDGLLHGLGGLELGARVLVPEAEAAIGADRRQRTVHGVEADVVHLPRPAPVSSGRGQVEVGSGSGGGRVEVRSRLDFSRGRVKADRI